MKILFIEWASYGNEDMKEAFLKEGHTLVSFPFFNKDARNDEKSVAQLPALIRREAPDAVFSFNYFPVVSNVCKRENIRYISWIYDSPYVMLYSYTAINPCNIIYVFDKDLYVEFHKAGIHTVHYLPMAANPDRLDVIESIVKEGLDEKAYPGCQVLVAKDGVIIYNKSFGYYAWWDLALDGCQALPQGTKIEEDDEEESKVNLFYNKDAEVETVEQEILGENLREEGVQFKVNEAGEFEILDDDIETRDREDGVRVYVRKIPARVKIWRTPQFNAWFKAGYMELGGEISGIEHFSKNALFGGHIVREFGVICLSIIFCNCLCSFFIDRVRNFFRRYAFG